MLRGPVPRFRAELGRPHAASCATCGPACGIHLLLWAMELSAAQCVLTSLTPYLPAFFPSHLQDNWPDMQSVCSDLSPFYLQVGWVVGQLVCWSVGLLLEWLGGWVVGCM